MPTSKVLVTGATGFIGRHLVKTLIAGGESVRIYCRNTRKAHDLFARTVEIAPGDILDSQGIVNAMKGCQRVFHIAGCYEFGLNSRHKLYSANVSGTGNVMAAAWSNKVEKIIHVSTAGFLGTGSVPIRETDFPPVPSRVFPYKRSKWEAESTALSWQKKGLPVIVASPTCPIGPGDDSTTPTGRMILDFLKGRFPFASRTGLNFIDIDDLTRGLLAAAKNGISGKRYILGAHNLWLTDFLKELSRLTGIPAPRITLPGSIILAAGTISECLHLLTRNRRAQRVCLETAMLSRRVQFFDTTMTNQELDWIPTIPLQETLTKSIAWFCQAHTLTIPQQPSVIG